MLLKLLYSALFPTHNRFLLRASLLRGHSCGVEGVHDVVFCEESTSWMPTVTLKDFAQNDSPFLIDTLMSVMW